MKVPRFFLTFILMVSLWALSLDPNGLIVAAEEETADTETSGAKEDPDKATVSTPLLGKFDADEDGFLSGEEIPPMMRQRMGQMDADSDGKLSEAELAAVPERGVRRMLGGEPEAGEGRGRGGMRAEQKPGEVVTPAAREEFTEQLLEVGGEAPDFTLPLRDGSGEVTLSSFEGKKPVVLIFGSITCSPFRQKVLGVKPIYEEFKDRAEFLMVYIREAHPESVIEVKDETGETVLKKFEQTDDFASRVESANYCTELLEFPWPVVVDREDNAVKNAYSGWPIRLMVIGKDGMLKYDGGRGPSGFQAEELAKWLKGNPEIF